MLILGLGESLVGKVPKYHSKGAYPHIYYFLTALIEHSFMWINPCQGIKVSTNKIQQFTSLHSLRVFSCRIGKLVSKTRLQTAKFSFNCSTMPKAKEDVPKRSRDKVRIELIDSQVQVIAKILAFCTHNLPTPSTSDNSISFKLSN